MGNSQEVSHVPNGGRLGLAARPRAAYSGHAFRPLDPPRRLMDLEARARAAGVEVGYEDYQGDFRRSPEASLLKVLEAIEEDSPRGPEEQGPLVLRRGARLPFDGPALVDTDTGDEMSIEGAIPDHMPFGYHTIRGKDEVPRRLIVSPGTCFLPENLRVWGWAAQIYSL